MHKLMMSFTVNVLIKNLNNFFKKLHAIFLQYR